MRISIIIDVYSPYIAVRCLGWFMHDDNIRWLKSSHADRISRVGKLIYGFALFIENATKHLCECQLNEDHSSTRVDGNIRWIDQTADVVSFDSPLHDTSIVFWPDGPNPCEYNRTTIYRNDITRCQRVHQKAVNNLAELLLSLYYDHVTLDTTATPSGGRTKFNSERHGPAEWSQGLVL